LIVVTEPSAKVAVAITPVGKELFVFDKAPI